jgi:hypothetical protein
LKGTYLILAACSTLVSAAFLEAPSSAPTFTRDAYPILEKTCIQCHRTNEMVPMPLTTYKEVRPWAAAIREAVLLRRIPPWYAEAPLGHFSNDWRLTADEISIIQRWADAHAPECNPADLAPARQFSEGWLRGSLKSFIALPDLA